MPSGSRLGPVRERFLQHFAHVVVGEAVVDVSPLAPVRDKPRVLGLQLIDARKRTVEGSLEVGRRIVQGLREKILLDVWPVSHIIPDAKLRCAFLVRFCIEAKMSGPFPDGQCASS
jgi:hypothetical protein